MKNKFAFFLLTATCGAQATQPTNPFSEMEEGFAKIMSSMQRMTDEIETRTMAAFGPSLLDNQDDDDEIDEAKDSERQRQPRIMSRSIQHFDSFSSSFGSNTASITADGKIKIELVGLEAPDAPKGDLRKETITNQKILSGNGPANIKLCQIKESADDYERFISISAEKESEESKTVRLSIEARLSTRSDKGFNSSRQVSKNFIEKIELPEGCVLEAKEVKTTKNSVEIELKKEAKASQEKTD